MVTPHKDCAQIAQSDFSSDCIKSSQAYWRMSRDFYVTPQGCFLRAYDGKYASKMCAKPSGVLCAVLPYVQKMRSLQVRAHSKTHIPQQNGMRICTANYSWHFMYQHQAGLLAYISTHEKAFPVLSSGMIFHAP